MVPSSNEITWLIDRTTRPISIPSFVLASSLNSENAGPVRAGQGLCSTSWAIWASPTACG